MNQSIGARHPDQELINAALRKDSHAVNVLVRRLTPAIQTRVARQLLRTELRNQGDLPKEVEDLTQEVFVTLFARQGHALLAWTPEGGASLETFVSLVAERLVISVLRSRRQSPLQHRAEDPATFDATVSEQPSTDANLYARETIARLTVTLRQRLSPRGLEMFHGLFVLQESIPELCARTGQSPEAVYQWRSRLRKLVRELAADPASPGSSPEPSSMEAPVEGAVVGDRATSEAVHRNFPRVTP